MHYLNTKMPRLARGSVVQLQTLNEVLLYSGLAPDCTTKNPGFYLKALRGKLRMSQAQLSRRSGVDQGQIARIESGKVEAELRTLRKLFGALFCDLLIIPKARRPLGDALGERNADRERVGGLRASVWAGRLK